MGGDDDNRSWCASVRIITPIDMDACLTISHEEEDEEDDADAKAVEQKQLWGGKLIPSSNCDMSSHTIEWSSGPSIPRPFREICPSGLCTPAAANSNCKPKPPESSISSSSDPELRVRVGSGCGCADDANATIVHVLDQESDSLTLGLQFSSDHHHHHQNSSCCDSSPRSPRGGGVTTTTILSQSDDDGHDMCQCCAHDHGDGDDDSTGELMMRSMVDEEVECKMQQLREEIDLHVDKLRELVNGALDDRMHCLLHDITSERIERIIESALRSKTRDIAECTSERVMNRMQCILDCKMREVMDMTDAAVSCRMRDVLDGVMRDLQLCKLRLTSTP